jgi:hypothetical protein
MVVFFLCYHPLFTHPSPFPLHPSPFTRHPSPFNLHPSPFTLHPSSFHSKRLLGDATLLNTLLDYDKEDMDLTTMNLIRDNYVSQTLFDPDMLSTISVAAMGLCMW